MSPRLYGQVCLEFKLRPFSADSVLALRKRIEPLSRHVGTLTQPLPEGEEKDAPGSVPTGRRGRSTSTKLTHINPLDRHHRSACFQSLKTALCAGWIRSNA